MTETAAIYKSKAIPYGLCHCGCGQRTGISKKTCKRSGHIKGHPFRFLPGHNSRGNLNPKWKNGIAHDKNRIKIWCPADNPQSKNNYFYKHVLNAEKALGQQLPIGSVVHHIDGNPANNENSNLIICENQAYHLLLHQRTRAYKACGHADWCKCKYCKQYDDPKNLSFKPNKTSSGWHPNCRNDYQRSLRKRRKHDRTNGIA